MTTSAGLEEGLGGHNISTTHVTLGSTRLMRNIGMMGEVVGAARTDIELPDNQHFNEGEYLEKPKDIKF